MWLFFTLLAGILWGVGQVIIKKGFNNLPPLFNNVLAAIIIPLIMIPLSLINGIKFDLVWSVLPLTFVIAILFLSYYYIIGMGQVAFTGTIIGTSPLFAILLSVVFLHENPSIFQKLAIFLIILGTTLIAVPDKVTTIKDLKLGSWFWWAICTAIAVGCADFFIKILINHSDVYTYLFTYSLCLIVVSILSIFFDKKGRAAMPAFTLKKYLPTLIGVVIMEIAFVSYHFALAQGLVSVVSPVSSTYIPITALLAWIFLKEKINKMHCTGIVLAAIGVIFVGIT